MQKNPETNPIEPITRLSIGSSTVKSMAKQGPSTIKQGSSFTVKSMAKQVQQKVIMSN